MIINTKPTRNQVRLLRFLGAPYQTKVIDWELCLYRKLNDHYDLEISNTARKGRNMSVYVWDISNGDASNARCIEKAHDIFTPEHLKKTLDKLALKYGAQQQGKDEGP